MCISSGISLVYYVMFNPPLSCAHSEGSFIFLQICEEFYPASFGWPVLKHQKHMPVCFSYTTLEQCSVTLLHVIFLLWLRTLILIPLKFHSKDLSNICVFF